MNADPLIRAENIVKEKGTIDPEELAYRIGIKYIKKTQTQKDAYLVFLDRRTPVIFLNQDLYLPGNQYEKERALWHEIAHFLEEHWKYMGSIIMDQASVFSKYLDDKDLAWTEAEANIISAHMTIQTRAFLDKIGYYSSSAMQWRRIQRLLTETKKEYSMIIDQCRFDPSPKNRQKLYSLRVKCMELENQLNDVELELAEMNYTTSIPTLAMVFHTNEAFIRYKLKALELLGYEGIENIELSPYKDAFKESEKHRAAGL